MQLYYVAIDLIALGLKCNKNGVDPLHQQLRSRTMGSVQFILRVVSSHKLTEFFFAVQHAHTLAPARFCQIICDLL